MKPEKPEQVEQVLPKRRKRWTRERVLNDIALACVLGYLIYILIY
ncbi:hypothetical protein [Lysobacter sp. CCNWLW3]